MPTAHAAQTQLVQAPLENHLGETTLAEIDIVWTTREGAVSALEPRWESLWERLGIEPRAGLFETTIARWTEPHRSYHTPQHLLECMGMHDFLSGYCVHTDIVALALWYHDIIYNVHQHDNEERSAELAYSTYVKSGGSPVLGDELRKIVLATSHRHPVKTVEAAVTADADLAILGAPRERFEEYERQVRAEYVSMEDRHYAVGRLKALAPFLSRRQIFRTPLLRNLLEERAQQNLGRSVLALQKQIG